LNSIALLVFPPIGNALHLTQSQFGLWAALAIHDTSSVVGAATKYGPQALVIGTTVKLARALWIVPLALVIAAVKRSRAEKLPGAANGVARVQFPWFIVFFVLAALPILTCRRCLRLPKHFHAGQTRAHSDIVSDWERNFTGHSERGRLAAAVAGCALVAGSGAHFAVLHSDGIHRVLAKR